MTPEQIEVIAARLASAAYVLELAWRHQGEPERVGVDILADMRAAVDALRALPSQGWQQMETAPKDGTIILGLCATQRDRYVPNHRHRGERLVYFKENHWISIPGSYTSVPSAWLPLPPQTPESK